MSRKKSGKSLRSRFTLKNIFAGIIAGIIIVGGATSLSLSQMSQDNRQQARGNMYNSRFNGVVLAEDTGGKRYIADGLRCLTGCKDLTFKNDESGGHFNAVFNIVAGSPVKMQLTPFPGYNSCSWQLIKRDCNNLSSQRILASGNNCVPQFEVGVKNCDWEYGVNFTMRKSRPSQTNKKLDIAASGTDAYGRYPTMTLKINNRNIKSWTVTNREQVYSVDVPSNTQFKDITIHFTNDAYDPYNRQDRNLRVNYVKLDNQVNQTEAANTWSSGTWSATNGCDPGNKQSEWLHCNGYFKFNK